MSSFSVSIDPRGYRSKECVPRYTSRVSKPVAGVCSEHFTFRALLVIQVSFGKWYAAPHFLSPPSDEWLAQIFV